MNVFTYTDRVSARCFAIIAILSLIMSAFPAPFSFAQAATAIIGPANVTVSNASNRHDSASANASSFTGLVLTFNYNAELLDAGDKFSYGWRSAGSDNELGFINGKNETGGNPATDETGSVSVNLPAGAQVSDLQVYFAISSNAADDQVQVINYKVEGDAVVVEDEDEEEENPGLCPDGYDKIVDDYEDGLSWTSDGYYDSVILVGGPKNENNDDPDVRNKYFTDVEPDDVIAREEHDISHICAIEGDEPEKGPAVISATKIMCPSEDMLPNGGFTNIDADTAQNFLDENPKCYAVEGWQFQWAFGGKSNGESPDNDGVLGSPWQTSEATKGTGKVEIEIPADEFDGPTTISFREVMQDDYVEFTGNGSENNVSAEIYCADDAANYDNLEWIPNVGPDTLNHCVAWNVPVYEPEEIEVCKYNDAKQPVEGWKFTLTNGDEEEGTFELVSGKDGCATKMVNPEDGPWTVIEEDREGWTQTGAYAEDGFVYTPKDSSNEVCEFFGERETLVKTAENTQDEYEDEEGYRCVFVNTPPEEPLVCKPGVNLLANPSFEDPEVDTAAGWDIFEDGTSGLAWVVDWVSSFLGAPENGWLEIQRNVNGWLPADGEQYAELDADWQGPTGGGNEEGSVAIGQTIATIPGKTYTLSWQFSPRPNTNASENKLDVSVDGDVVKSNTAAGGGTNSWTANSYTFVAAGDETEVTFADAGTPNSVGTFLDDVSLACGPEEDPEETVTIVATKIVCEDEADLPNWGTGVGPQMIDADTASEWVAEHDDSCRLEKGWNFEWAAPGTSNPDNNLPTTAFYVEGGEDWNTFGPTNEDGVATVVIGEDDFTEGDYLWMREVLKEGYIPFTYGPTNQFNSNNVSAELYCHKDVLNFDNYDRVDDIYGDKTYYCVAWNVEEEPEEPAPMCDLTVVSDATNTVATEGNPFAKLVTWFHPDWDAVVPFGAAWIWGDDPVVDPVNETTQTFEKKFMWTGPVADAILKIAADNTYEVALNGVVIAWDASQKNFITSDTYDLSSYIDQGENTLSIKVKNLAQGGGTIYTNPAGLNYALDINGADESCRPNDDGDNEEENDDEEENPNDDEEENEEDDETVQTSGGNGKKVSLGGDNESNDEPEGEVAGDSTSKEAAPGVAGDQTSIYPAGAPNAGAGGAANSTAQALALALFTLVFALVLRSEKAV